MHVEKIVFDNIINTVLNVPGKTKYNVNSCIHMTEICNRKDPLPLYKLSPDAKICLFDWLKDEVKFSDGYASSISSSDGVKLSKMKSHDCHVFMQRLLPIAFAELLPNNIHQTLSGMFSRYKFTSIYI